MTTRFTLSLRIHCHIVSAAVKLHHAIVQQIIIIVKMSVTATLDKYTRIICAHTSENAHTHAAISIVVVGDCKADVIFVLDSSGSIGFMNWFHVKQFVMDVVLGLKVRQLRFPLSDVKFINKIKMYR